MIDGGNVEDGKELAVEDAYAAPANDKQITVHLHDDTLFCYSIERGDTMIK